MARLTPCRMAPSAIFLRTTKLVSASNTRTHVAESASSTEASAWDALTRTLTSGSVSADSTRERAAGPYDAREPMAFVRTRALVSAASCCNAPIASAPRESPARLRDAPRATCSRTDDHGELRWASRARAPAALRPRAIAYAARHDSALSSRARYGVTAAAGTGLSRAAARRRAACVERPSDASPSASMMADRSPTSPSNRAASLACSGPFRNAAAASAAEAESLRRLRL